MNMGRTLECVMGTVERALDVARHGVEPLHVPASVAARAPTLSTNMCVWADEGAEGAQSVAADPGVYERDLGWSVTQTRRISCDCGLTPNQDES
jgi:hypothetical protein